MLEMMTYRWHGHNEGEEVFSGRYRPDEEIAEWKARDPIPRLWGRLLESGHASESELEAMDQEEVARVEAALTFAEESPEPDPEEAVQNLYPGDSLIAAKQLAARGA